MPRRVATEDDWEDDDGDGWTPDDGDEEWVPDDENDDETVACPHCDRPVHDQAERCPHCGWYISEEDAPPARRPWWVVLGLILALVAVYLWVAPW